MGGRSIDLHRARCCKFQHSLSETEGPDVSPTRGWLCPRIKNIYRLHNTLAVKGAFSQRMRANRRSRLNVNGFRGMAFFALPLRQQCACACAS